MKHWFDMGDRLAHSALFQNRAEEVIPSSYGRNIFDFDVKRKSFMKPNKQIDVF